MITIFAEELFPNIKDYDVILFGMALNHSFNQGFLYDLALNFPDIKQYENRGTGYGDRRKYGTIFSIVSHDSSILSDKATDSKIFCACYMNDGGYNRKDGNLDCVRYDSLEKCLIAVKERYKGYGFKIAAPIIGASYYDGAGDKEKILSIFRKVFTDVDIDLYDYEQKDFKTENFRQFNQACSDYKNGKITKEEYKEKKRILSWQKEHGILEKVPVDYQYEAKNNLIHVKKSDLE